MIVDFIIKFINFNVQCKIFWMGHIHNFVIINIHVCMKRIHMFRKFSRFKETSLDVENFTENSFGENVFSKEDPYVLNIKSRPENF